MKQQSKHIKYKETANTSRARLLPFAVETCGGMGSDAMTLMQVISEAGQEHLGLWPRDQIVRHLLESVATAVQRGNAMTVLAGYSRTVARASGEMDRE